MAKQKYTIEQVCQALDATEGQPAEAAVKLGCWASTIYNYAERYPTVRERIKHYKEVRLDKSVRKLWELIDDGNVAAIIFHLKTQGKERGYTERNEITGKDGEALELTTRVVRKHEADA